MRILRLSNHQPGRDWVDFHDMMSNHFMTQLFDQNAFNITIIFLMQQHKRDEILQLVALPSLSELAPYLISLGLTHLGLEASKYIRPNPVKSSDI